MGGASASIGAGINIRSSPCHRCRSCHLCRGRHRARPRRRRSRRQRHRKNTLPPPSRPAAGQKPGGALSCWSPWRAGRMVAPSGDAAARSCPPGKRVAPRFYSAKRMFCPRSHGARSMAHILARRRAARDTSRRFLLCHASDLEWCDAPFRPAVAVLERPQRATTRWSDRAMAGVSALIRARIQFAEIIFFHPLRLRPATRHGKVRHPGFRGLSRTPREACSHRRRPDRRVCP